MTTQQPTFDDMLKLFQEIRFDLQEVRLDFQASDRKFQETDRFLTEKFRETDLQFKETDRKFKETDLQFKETALQFKETALQLKETDRMLKEVGKKIGRLGNRLGDFVQEMVKPAVVRLFQERGIDVHEVHSNIYVERHGYAAEIDLLVVNDSEAIAVECKSHLSIEDVNEHLERLSKFKHLLPKYQDVQLSGAVAAMVMPNDVARFAYRKGLYVLAQSGDTVTIRNDEQFVPTYW